MHTKTNKRRLPVGSIGFDIFYLDVEILFADARYFISFIIEVLDDFTSLVRLCKPLNLFFKDILHLPLLYRRSYFRDGTHRANGKI